MFFWAKNTISCGVSKSDTLRIVHQKSSLERLIRLAGETQKQWGRRHESLGSPCLDFSEHSPLQVHLFGEKYFPILPIFACIWLYLPVFGWISFAKIRHVCRFFSGPVLVYRNPAAEQTISGHVHRMSG
jgi:hypothetical protein